MIVVDKTEARPHEVEDVFFAVPLPLADEDGKPLENTEQDGPHVFTTPKSSLVLSAIYARADNAAFVEARLKWMEEGFGAEGWEHILQRLENPKDVFDWPDVLKTFDTLWAWATNRPSSSAGGSPESPAASSPKAAPKPPELTSGA